MTQKKLITNRPTIHPPLFYKHAVLGQYNFELTNFLVGRTTCQYRPLAACYFCHSTKTNDLSHCASVEVLQLTVTTGPWNWTFIGGASDLYSSARLYGQERKYHATPSVEATRLSLAFLTDINCLSNVWSVETVV